MICTGLSALLSFRFVNINLLLKAFNTNIVTKSKQNRIHDALAP